MRKYSFIVALALAAAVLAGRPGTARADAPFDAMALRVWAFADEHIARTAADIAPARYPIYTGGTGAWFLTDASAWTSGFWPGLLWLLYEHTGDEGWRHRAQAWQAPLAAQAAETTTHDLGFMVLNSFGNGYRLTGIEAYREVVLTAAAALATRFSPAVGAIKSWDPWGNDPSEFRTIVDNLMNLELLFWAAEHGGRKAWRQLAVRHALRTLADHVRPDGSTYHVVTYDPVTGAVLRKSTHQGASPTSSWARGQAWALHGFTIVYRETRDPRFLRAARKVTDYYLAHLPADMVPYWDFQAPAIPLEPRDSSAAAIAASGLLALAQLDPDPTRRARYRNAAEATLVSLSSLAYLAAGTPSQSLLLHGTYNKPAVNFDTGTIWGDYYFLEALLRLRRLPVVEREVTIVGVHADGGTAHAPGAVLDDDPGTFWAACSEGDAIRFDLGSATPVTKVRIGFHRGDRRATRFAIQLSPDGTRWQTVFRGLSSGRTRAPEVYDFAERSAAYVRIVGYGNTKTPCITLDRVDIY